MSGIAATPGVIVLAPVAWWIIAVVIAAASAAAIGGAIYYFGEDARRARITLTGPRKSGKTTLRHLLTSGVITREYLQTRVKETVDADVKIADLELRLRVTDVGGGRDQFRDWLDASQDCAVMVYVIDLARTKTDRKYADLAEQGSRHIKNYRESGDLPAGSRIILVGTHIDEDPDPDFDRTLAHPRIKKISANLRPDETIFANLLDRGDTDKVLYTIATAAGRR